MNFSEVRALAQAKEYDEFNEIVNEFVVRHESYDISEYFHGMYLRGIDKNT